VTVLERTGEWLVTAYSVSDRQLGLARIVFAAYMLLVVGVPSFAWLADAPDILFNPPVLSPANLLDGWPPPVFFYLLSAGLQVGFVLLLFGIATPVTSVAIGVMLLAGFNLAYSFGKIDHAILLALAPIVMSISGWGNRYRLFARNPPPAERRDRNAAALAILALLVGFGMLTAALPKLWSGWLDPATQAVYGHAVYSYYFGRHDFLLGLPFSLDVPWLWELLDWGAIAFEGLFIFTVRWPRLFRVFLLLAVPFHLVNLLIVNISFTSNLAVYAVFARWQALYDGGLPRVVGPIRWVALGSVFVLVIGAWLLHAGDPPEPANGSIVKLLLTHVAAVSETAVRFMPLLVACGAALALAWKGRRGWRDWVRQRVTKNPVAAPS
jgi:hypothetical protein